MSTHFKTKKTSNIKTALGVIAILLVWLIAWQGSTSSGGNRGNVPSEIITQILENEDLTYLCRKIGEELVDASISRQIAQFRPTASLFAKKEERITNAWFAAQCPVSPLLAISYGANEFAKADMRRRMSY